MSAVYPKFRQSLLQWSVDVIPAGMTYHAVAVDSTYVYDPAHWGQADISGSVISQVMELVVTDFTDGIIKADTVVLEGLVQGVSVAGVIVVLTDQNAEFHLVCFIDESSDGSMPQLINTDTGEVRWNPSGICRI